MNPTPLLALVAREKKKALSSGDYTALEEICLSPEFQALPYELKNFHFITSSKLKMFQQCPLAYKYKYIDLVPDITTEDKDHFLIGQAFDDRLTHGEVGFAKRYHVVARRSEKAQEEAGNRTMLNPSHVEQIDMLYKEFCAQTLFNPKPEKKVFFWKYKTQLVKVELDDFDKEKKEIRDMKTARSVTNFDPDFYTLQFSLYHLVVEENLQERYRVIAEIVDKYAYFSRSRAIEYTQDTLLSARGSVMSLLEKLTEAESTGLYMQTPERDVAYSMFCYGHEGYGRPTELELY